MYVKCMQRLLFALSIPLCFCTCTKYTNELPVVKIPKERLIVPVFSGGINIADFIFEKIKTPDSDTVFLSIRNNRTTDLTNLQYVVEFCRKQPQSFDNCDQQYAATIPGTIKADSTHTNVYKWINKSIELNPDLVNAGITFFEGGNQHPLANAYYSIYSKFETDTLPESIVYYGQAKGFILTDGLAVFRLKAPGAVNYSAEGLFTQVKDFTGLFSRVSPDFANISTFQLATLTVNGERVLADTSQPQQLGFRLQLHQALDGTIRSVYFLLQKHEN